MSGREGSGGPSLLDNKGKIHEIVQDKCIRNFF